MEMSYYRRELNIKQKDFKNLSLIRFDNRSESHQKARGIYRKKG
jgi:hypothetical protein